MSTTKLVVRSSNSGLKVLVDNRKPKLVLLRVNVSKEKKKLSRNAAAKRFRHKQQFQLEQQRRDEKHRKQLEDLEPVLPEDPFFFGSHFLSEMFPTEHLELPEDNPDLHFANDFEVCNLNEKILNCQIDLSLHTH